MKSIMFRGIPVIVMTATEARKLGVFNSPNDANIAVQGYVSYIDEAFEQGLLGDKPTGSDILMCAQKLWKDEIRTNVLDKLLVLAEDEEFVAVELE